MKLIAYYRVSTAQQGRSGLGLEAQAQAVQAHAQAVGGQVIATFTEVESGKRNDRPELAKALQAVKLRRAKLVIAKLDRLSRNAAFLLTLKESGVPFVCADMPHADNLTIGVLALVAQQEREATSKRTREALQAAKRRGVKLGNPNGAAALRRAGKGNAAAASAAADRARAYACEVLPRVAELQAAGVTSLAAIASALNAEGTQTVNGKAWHKSSVRNLLHRAA